MKATSGLALIQPPQAPETRPAGGLGVWACNCEICSALSTADLTYLAGAFSETSHCASTGEDIADCLGYCARHGAAVFEGAVRERRGANVLDVAITRVLPFLQRSRFGEERFQQVYFGAEHACPACAYERRVVGRQAGRLARHFLDQDMPQSNVQLGTLCALHFQAVSRRLKPEGRMPVLANYSAVLEATASGMNAAAPGDDGAHAGQAQPPIVSELLERAAGSVLTRGARPRSSIPDSVINLPSIEHSLSCTSVCCTCLEIERSRRRWLAALPLAVAHGLDGWLFFPTCPEHIADVADLGNGRATGAVCAHAVHVAAEYCHQQLRVLVRAAETEAEIAAARIARWGRRPRRRKIDPPKPPQPRLVRCAACERLAIAELQATTKLLRLLRAEKHRSSFQRGFGLCMKHHAHAYLMAPQGIVRTFLCEDQRARLMASQQHLHLAAAAESAGLKAPHSLVDLQSAWHRFCGFG